MPKHKRITAVRQRTPVQRATQEQAKPREGYSLAPHFLSRLDAKEFELPDGTLMSISEMAMRADKPATLLRFWIATHRPDVYARYMRERETATARRIRDALA
jgi:hypothetical protein